MIDNTFREELKLAQMAAEEGDYVSACTLVSEKGLTGGKDVKDSVQRALARLGEVAGTKGVGEDYETVMLVGRDGTVFAASNPSYPNASMSDRDYFKSAIAGTSNTGDAVVSKVTNKPIVPVAIPVKSSSGKVEGALVFALSIQFVQDLVSAEKIGTTGYAFVVDATGLVIAHPNTANVMKLKGLEIQGMSDFIKKMIAQKTGVDPYVFNGVAKTAGYAPIATTKWSAGLTLPGCGISGHRE